MQRRTRNVNPWGTKALLLLLLTLITADEDDDDDDDTESGNVDLLHYCAHSRTRQYYGRCHSLCPQPNISRICLLTEHH